MQRLIVGMTGATGAPIAIRLLEALRETGVESHLAMSKWAMQTIELETPFSVQQVRDLASVSYGPGDMAAAIASGSFLSEGMAVVPCSVRTLAGIAHGYGDHLVHRAADVVLKERRRLVLAVRETPLSEVHLENMLKLTRMGAIVLPPMLTFYTRPEHIADMVDHVVTRILDQFGLQSPFGKRWEGTARSGGASIHPLR